MSKPKNDRHLMNRESPPIYFYLPECYWGRHMPRSVNDYWDWRVAVASIDPGQGKLDWTMQTYLYLKEDGFPCELTKTLPSKGIVLAHREFLRDTLLPGRNILLVCLKADKLPHPYAQIHVLQNSNDIIARKRKEHFENIFIPHWIQPRLIPRNKERGSSFVSAGYYGDEDNATEELKRPLWRKLLNEMGLEWRMVTDPAMWADYSDIDVLVAVRRFGSKATDFTDKPATKLYNAWHAGVPAILAVESAYAAERKNELDYVEVSSSEETIDALRRIRDDQVLREAMAGNGKIRAHETNAETTIKKWRSFLIDIATPAYHRWCSSYLFREKYLNSLQCVHLYTWIKGKISCLRKTYMTR